MTYRRYSREEIVQHIANCDGAGFPTNSTIKVMRQLLADNNKLIHAIKQLRYNTWYGGEKEINDFMDDVLREVDNAPSTPAPLPFSEGGNMPKIILEFDSFEERDDALQAQHGGDYASAVHGFKEDLRRKYKLVVLTDEQSKIIDEVWEMIGENFNGLVGL